METNISENPSSKSARKRQRDAELKENDIEEWERRRNHKSEYGKLWRQQNPARCTEYAKRSAEKRRIKRILEHNAKCAKFHENIKSRDRLFNC